MAPDSRRLKPISLAVIPHPRNLVKNETTQIRMVYPQVTPLFRRPKLVRRPERAKYCHVLHESDVRANDNAPRLTRGSRRIDNRSSSFSTREIAYPFSCGMMSPDRNAPCITVQ